MYVIGIIVMLLASILGVLSLCIPGNYDIQLDNTLHQNKGSYMVILNHQLDHTVYQSNYKT